MYIYCLYFLTGDKYFRFLCRISVTLPTSSRVCRLSISRFPLLCFTNLSLHFWTYSFKNMSKMISERLLRPRAEAWRVNVRSTTHLPPRKEIDKKNDISFSTTFFHQTAHQRCGISSPIPSSLPFSRLLSLFAVFFLFLSSLTSVAAQVDPDLGTKTKPIKFAVSPTMPSSDFNTLQRYFDIFSFSS